MKKIISVILIFLLCAISCIPATAAQDGPVITLQPQNTVYSEMDVALYEVKAEGNNLSATWYMEWQGKTYTISDTNRNYVDVKLTISYRRSPEQMGRLVNVTGVTALRDLLAAAAENGASEMAVQLANFYSDAAAIYAIVDEVAAAQEGGASWQVAFYPDEARAGIVEIVMGE